MLEIIKYLASMISVRQIVKTREPNMDFCGPPPVSIFFRGAFCLENIAFSSVRCLILKVLISLIHSGDPEIGPPMGLTGSGPILESGPICETRQF